MIQTGALPYRLRNGTTEILLITSRTRRRWIIPKGNPMKDKTLAEAAAIEAYEEAGVRGKIESEPTGRYTHGIPPKKEVEVYLLHVTELLDEYPEAHERQRKWFSVEEAYARVFEQGLKEILRASC